jgi:lycopene beta-cyclase
MSKINVLITGSGPAALSLASLLADQANVTLVSDTLSPKDDKTWCFWDIKAAPNPDLIHHSWHQLRVIGRDGRDVISQPGEASYHCIRSATYQQYLLDKLSSCPTVSLVEARVQAIKNDGNKARIETDSDTFEADLVFQSHARPADSITYSAERIALKQHFLGWDIHCEKPVFNPKEAILMDFRVSQEFGFAFVYVLPFSPTQALVEVTYFTAELLANREMYESQIANYLLDFWGIQSGSYSIERQEFGIIPMTDGHVSGQNENPIYSIGLAGGHAKASTGYAFARIQRDSARIAESLNRGECPARDSLSPARFRFYDLLILNILKNSPDHAVVVFEALFRKNGFRAMFDFLDEKTNFAEELRIMASVPSYAAFFRSMGQTRKRLQTIILQE